MTVTRVTGQEGPYDQEGEANKEHGKGTSGHPDHTLRKGIR